MNNLKLSNTERFQYPIQDSMIPELNKEVAGTLFNYFARVSWKATIYLNPVIVTFKKAFDASSFLSSLYKSAI